MLLKLLKNDMKAVFKYWWIGAVISFGLSFVGGILLHFLNNYEGYSGLLIAVCSIGLMLVFGAISSFSLLSTILVVIRYYKNFFTDEGYLTFTLPVKRNQLLLSKFITGVIATAASGIVIAIDMMIVFVMGAATEPEIYDGLNSITFDLNFIYSYWYYIIEGILICIGMVLLSVLLIYACITFASIVMKKAKVFWAIAIYYGVTSIISVFFQISFTVGGAFVIGWLSEMSLAYIKSVVAIFLFVVILFLAILCLGLYTLNHWMLDKKLNLN